MDLIHYVVKDGVLDTSNDRSVSRQVSQRSFHLTQSGRLGERLQSLKSEASQP